MNERSTPEEVAACLKAFTFLITEAFDVKELRQMIEDVYFDHVHAIINNEKYELDQNTQKKLYALSLIVKVLDGREDI